MNRRKYMFEEKGIKQAYLAEKLDEKLLYCKLLCM
ncbi:hypothetical protein SAMN05444376_1396 [Bacteroides clarus YIT 12056]|mgnify:CR=1 FL=1|nr:hypothetical protein SAMN05444376_1396 [Bacteroides clarus YIT 12056]